MKTKFAALAMLSCLIALGGIPTASAETLTAKFTNLVPGLQGTDPAPVARFTLNNDGTITGSVTATSANGLYEFGFNGPNQYVFSNLPDRVNQTGGLDTPVGAFNGGGWDVNTSFSGTVPSATWIIGTQGSFSSVGQLFSHNAEGYDVFAGTRNGNVFTGWVGTVAAVPEPETYGLMLAGLAMLYFVRRRHTNINPLYSI